jgi:hypothetical protein
MSRLSVFVILPKRPSAAMDCPQSAALQFPGIAVAQEYFLRIFLLPRFHFLPQFFVFPQSFAEVFIQALALLSFADVPLKSAFEFSVLRTVDGGNQGLV